jgi:hypothetical protein
MSVRNDHYSLCNNTEERSSHLLPLLGHYTANSGNSLLKFRDNLLVPSSTVKNSFWILEDGTNKLCQNVGKELPLLAA